MSEHKNSRRARRARPMRGERERIPWSSTCCAAAIQIDGGRGSTRGWKLGKHSLRTSSARRGPSHPAFAVGQRRRCSGSALEVAAQPMSPRLAICRHVRQASGPGRKRRALLLQRSPGVPSSTEPTWRPRRVKSSAAACKIHPESQVPLTLSRFHQCVVGKMPTGRRLRSATVAPALTSAADLFAAARFKLSCCLLAESGVCFDAASHLPTLPPSNASNPHPRVTVPHTDRGLSVCLDAPMLPLTAADRHACCRLKQLSLSDC